MKIQYDNAAQRERKSKKIKRVLLWSICFWVLAIVIFGSVCIYQAYQVQEIEKSMNEQGEIRNPSVDRVESEDMGKDIPVKKLTGTWVSDRNPATLLTLNEDLTYVDEVWLGYGQYKINGSYLLLNDQTGKKYEKRVLKYKEEGKKEELLFNIENYITTFHRGTKEEIEEIQEYINKITTTSKKRRGDNKEVVFQFLTSRTWKTNNGKEITFNEDSVTIKENETIKTYQFTVDSDVDLLEGSISHFTIPWKINNVSSANMEVYYKNDMNPYVNFSLEGTEYKAYSEGMPYFYFYDACTPNTIFPS